MHDIDTVRMELEAQDEGLNYEGELAEETTMSEAEEEMLAAELLGVASEAEMEQFFGKLFKRIAKGARGAASFLAKNARPLAGALKGIAKAALPTVGAALGSAIPIPGVGTALGGALGGAASNLLEAELEGLNQEDREFEVAKRVVRLTNHAARAGARRPPTANRRAAVVGSLRDGLRRMRARQIAMARARSARARRARAAGSRPVPPDPALVGIDNADAGGGGYDLADAGVADAGGGDLDSGYAGDDGLGDVVADDAAAGDDAGEFEWESAPPMGGARSGRWVRRGGKIVLLGV